MCSTLIHACDGSLGDITRPPLRVSLPPEADIKSALNTLIGRLRVKGGHRRSYPAERRAGGRFVEKLPETALAGWRHSADRLLLCPLSLLTGNFTGNFPKLVVSGTSETAKCAVVAELLTNSPLNGTGNYFGGTGNFCSGTGNFASPNPGIAG